MLVIEEITQALASKELRTYLKSLFLSTRLLDTDLSVQPIREPRGFEEAYQISLRYRDIFGQAIRGAYPSLYDLSIKIENTKDDIERLALWASHLDQQQV